MNEEMNEWDHFSSNFIIAQLLIINQLIFSQRN